MRLYRGTRTTSGECHVIVYDAGGETQLAVEIARGAIKQREYDWGNGERGTYRLAYDLLLSVTYSSSITECLVDEFVKQWLSCVRLERWAYADFEIARWVRDELYAMWREAETRPTGGLPPCPSEN